LGQTQALRSSNPTRLGQTAGAWPKAALLKMNNLQVNEVNR
jgi:hypothetical protein